MEALAAAAKTNRPKQWVDNDCPRWWHSLSDNTILQCTV